MKNTRRQFLQSASVTAAAASVPLYYSKSAHAVSSANDRKTVACVGVGGSRGRYNRGGNVARQAAKLGQAIAVCDVDYRHNEEFGADLKKTMNADVNPYVDYRQMLEQEKPDIVTIGTPDHWHVPIAIASMKAGADVYCEKPLTLTIQEGIDICKVVKETGKVFQVGTQQRSEMGQMFLRAVAIVQCGLIGDDIKVDLAVGGAPKGGPFVGSEPPSDLDWNMWLGPAPKALFSDERRRMFRWFFEYSGGKMTDWGAHHIDIATWAMGKDSTGPIKVSGSGSLPPCVPENFDFPKWFAGDLLLPNAYNTATDFHLKLEYADGMEMNVHSNYVSEDGKTKFPNGILFQGSEGRFFVNRGKLTGAPVEKMSEADKVRVEEKMLELYGSKPNGHMQNFYDCIDSRKDPVSDVYSHHRTMTSAHLCNIALMLGRDLNWDPKNQVFIGDDQAEALKSRPQREGFTME